MYKSLLYLTTLQSLSSFFNPLLRALPKREYSNLALSTTPCLYPKSSPLKYSNLSSSLDDNAESLAASLSRLY